MISTYIDPKVKEKPVVIIGGGIVGLSCAWYLRLAGYPVTVIDRGDLRDNCSFGNAGYISPSHFVPLASPSALRVALRALTDSSNPLYIAPRLSLELIGWGLEFLRNSNAGHVKRSSPALRDILMLSRAEYASWAEIPEFDFAFRPCGMLELFQSESIAKHAPGTVETARSLGLDARLLTVDECQALEPDVHMKASGGIFFADDAQVYPPKLMQQLLKRLPEMGVNIIRNSKVLGFKTEDGRVNAVMTASGEIRCSELVVAAGAWSRELGRSLGFRFPLVGGRGYSVTYDPAPFHFKHSVILEDASVAISPMDGDKLRFGGTMEITKVGSPLRLQRVQRILDGVRRFFPEIDLPMPPLEQVWHGYRPVSKDGLPYIGRHGKWRNVVVATGHGMLGLSMGAATGKLVKEIVAGEKNSIGMNAFALDR